VKNLEANPKVSLPILDPVNPYRYVELRGDAEIAADPDYAFAAAMRDKYGADPRDNDNPGETRVVMTIKPVRVHALGGAAET
jgi:hypothetical protein